MAECFSGIHASVLSRLNLTHAPSCSNASETESYQGFQSGTTSGPLTADLGAEKSISSAGDSPARTSRRRVKAKESLESEVACGLKCSELLAKFDHASSFWKIATDCPEGGFIESLEDFPQWGTILHGECFQLLPLVPHTPVKGSMVWPTPTTMKYGHTVGRWDEIGGSWNKFQRTDFGKTKIHPEAFEWMMGWPIGWTELRPLATARFQLWLQQHSES